MVSLGCDSYQTYQSNHGRVIDMMYMQVYQRQISRDGPGLEIQLRSDLEELPQVPVQVQVPTVWLLGNTAAATRSLMSAIAQQSGPARTAPATHVAPAEVFMDGVKWCNLLAAPVTTPALALSALAYALPANPEAGVERTGPIRMANHVMQVRPTTQAPVTAIKSLYAGLHINLTQSCILSMTLVESGIEHIQQQPSLGAQSLRIPGS